jgi:multidrug efflux pump subunit AcrA (membrane-fusion protein)
MKFMNKRNYNTHGDVVAKLRERDALLITMRSEAEAVLDAAKADRQNHLTGGDLSDGDVVRALHNRVDAAGKALAGLDEARADVAIKIADAEAAQHAEQRRVQAEVNAKALAAVIANVKENLPGFLATAREMSELLGSLNNFRYQVGGVSNYLANVANETEAGLRVVLADLSGAVDEVARGERAITIGKPEPTPIAATPAVVPPKDHFTYSVPKPGATYRVPAAFTKEK